MQAVLYAADAATIFFAAYLLALLIMELAIGMELELRKQEVFEWSVRKIRQSTIVHVSHFSSMKNNNHSVTAREQIPVCG